MKVLVDILKDSQAHYLDVQSRILKRLEAIPPGSIFKRRLGGGDYYYRVFRKGPRVVSQYIGKDEPVQALKELEEKHLLLNRLKEVRRSLAILGRLHWEKPLARRHR